MIAGIERYDAETGEFFHEPVAENSALPSVCPAGLLTRRGELGAFEVSQPPPSGAEVLPPGSFLMTDTVADLSRTRLGGGGER